jgi:hypothetical protein
MTSDLNVRTLKVKEWVFQNKPHTTDKMKRKIINTIRQSNSMTVRYTIDNMQCQIRMSLIEDSGHFWCMMWCQFLPYETRYVSYQSYHTMCSINIIMFCSPIHDLQLSVWVSFYYEPSCINKYIHRLINPLPLLFKSLLPGQEDCVFFQWAFKFTCKTRNRNPLQGKNYNN